MGNDISKSRKNKEFHVGMIIFVETFVNKRVEFYGTDEKGNVIFFTRYGIDDWNMAISAFIFKEKREYFEEKRLKYITDNNSFQYTLIVRKEWIHYHYLLMNKDGETPKYNRGVIWYVAHMYKYGGGDGRFVEAPTIVGPNK